MKKGLFLIVFCLYSTMLIAQEYSFKANPNPVSVVPLFLNAEVDTLKTTITNLSTNTNDLSLQWEITDINIPDQWEVAVCDFNDCHLPHILSSSSPNYLGFQQSKEIAVVFMDQGISGIGSVSIKITCDNDSSLVETVSFSLLNFTNGNVQTIEGNISFQDDDDCTYEEANRDMSNWMIKADGATDFYGYTDSLGNYWMYVFSGEYTLSAIPPNDNWTVCNNDIQLFTSFLLPDTTVNFVAQKEYVCPLLEVDVSTANLRRCFNNRYFVNYRNLGSASAHDAYVELFFDEYFTVYNSSIPYSNLVDNSYRFELGDLEIDTSGSFYVDVYLACNNTVLGQTHCVEAHIFPDTLCSSVNEMWSGAEIELGATCEGDSIRFKIENVGNASSKPGLEYKIIEDHVILLQDNFELAPGDSLISVVATNGKTFRLEAEQEPFFPNESSPSVVLELCGDDPNMSLGQINMFPLDDNAIFKSIDCQENRGSLAEGEKIAFPKGYGNDQKIEENTVVEYMIHFQNAGTDTAFNIIILDTISEFLDISSIQTGSASHPYDLQIIGGNLVRFSFSDIMLPDSSTNEIASHGFVKFKIQLKGEDHNPPFFFLKNTATIFFDFNRKVQTNTIFHKVGERVDPLSIIDPPAKQVNILVYPNPFKESAIFELKNSTAKQSIFSLHDLQGRLQRKEKFKGNWYHFQTKELHAGMYIYSIEQEGILLAAGKLIIK